MLTKVRYSYKEMARWTRWESLAFTSYATAICTFYVLADHFFFHLPWAPLAVVGTAVAFIIGFQNNAAYGRIWEARKIWGGIVNNSRIWGMKTADMVTPENSNGRYDDQSIKKIRCILVYRHIAWLTALRHSMRQKKKWEVFDKHITNREWSALSHIPERITSLSDDLVMYLSEEELTYVLSKGNKATAILYLQSRHIRKLKEEGALWKFAFLQLENVLGEFFNLQGKSERIKNFPYPRQYATLGHIFVWIFILLFPFATVPEFSEIGKKLAVNFPFAGTYFVWLSIPFCALVAWIFHTMERIGRVGENPFEGSANDVPISTISRAIEIDLRQMLDEDAEEIPGQFPELNDVQM
ncbi:bestrophin family protein [Persicobacter diffluens]|uniref:Multidrug transporter n=1 Tax=Persicobacter diffluens TaxID=981 RepID=A0AAN4W2Q6_9BACT|nr:hypothetical protein PEDI_41680 [Persicobacter diffluens]